jgi:hypothetical protein
MRTFLLPLAGLFLLASCTEDGGSRSNTDPGILPDAAGANPPASEGCPDSQPKVGENCGPGITESNRCDFVVGECTAPNGMTYVETVTYCCTTGVWENCGGRSPCDNIPEVDAAAPVPLPDGGAPDASEVHPEVGSD